MGHKHHSWHLPVQDQSLDLASLFHHTSMKMYWSVRVGGGVGFSFVFKVTRLERCFTPLTVLRLNYADLLPRQDHHQDLGMV